jgi:glycosyltransferase involved in cell wall biosynthesis
MDVVVNGRFLSRRVTGVERYGREILRCLPGEARVLRPRLEVQRAGGHAWEQFVLPERLRPGEVLWSPANTGPLAVANQVLTLHDLTPLEHPGWFKPAFGLWYRTFVPLLVKRVRQLVVSSEHVRKKILSRFSLPPERVSVVPGGVDLAHFHSRQPASSRLPSCYVLFVGSLQPRKNLGALLEAWERVIHQFPEAWLRVAGVEEHPYRFTRLPGEGKNVRFLGYVPEAELPALYAGAVAFVIPSLDEGFGLPVLEAMACGTPVIAARAGALPEVVGEAGLFFDPKHPDELAGALERCLGDGKLRLDLAEKGLSRINNFSWQDSAEKLWKVLETCR